MSCGVCEGVRRFLPVSMAEALRGLDQRRVKRKAEKRERKRAIREREELAAKREPFEWCPVHLEWETPEQSDACDAELENASR